MVEDSELSKQAVTRLLKRNHLLTHPSRSVAQAHRQSGITTTEGVDGILHETVSVGLNGADSTPDGFYLLGDLEAPVKRAGGWQVEGHKWGSRDQTGLLDGAR